MNAFLTEQNAQGTFEHHSLVELLAPAGNKEAFDAAMSAGADAIYVGVGDFNARRNAGNFSFEELAEACHTAHLQQVRVYLTLNTLITDEEVLRVLKVIDRAWHAGIDALIVQDLGVLRLVQQYAPQIPVHISTQLNVLNANAVATAAQLGACRVTLGREISLQELPSLCSQGVEIEVFAHGALCVCYSGQCLMSSMVGARSANRGLCAQPCRLPYQVIDFAGNHEGETLAVQGEYVLSPKDLCTIDILPQLIAAGVSSLKIEGRMKSPEYVAMVVSVYRACLDRALADPASYKVLSQEHQMLAEAFSRGFTTGYLEHNRGSDLMSYQRPNNRGVPVGRVVSVQGSFVKLSCTQDVRVGDVLEFWTRKGRVTARAETLQVEDRLVPIAPAGTTCTLAAEGVRQGDRAFRVRSQALSDEVAQLKKRCGAAVVPLEFFVRAETGKPLLMEVRDKRGYRAAVEGPLCEPARTKSITAEEIQEHVGRLGGTIYTLESCTVKLDGNIGMGYSVLHKLRSAAIAQLEEHILQEYVNRAPLAFDEEQVALAPAQERSEGPLEAGLITANEELAHMAAALGARIYASPAALARWDNPSMATCLMPTVIFDQEYPDLLAIAKSAKAVVCDSVWALARCKAEGLQAEAGPRCNVLNGYAASALENLGATSLWISPESTLAQIEKLGAKAAVPLTMHVRGRCELMVTEQCQLSALGSCAGVCATCARRNKSLALKDRKGYVFPVATDAFGRGHIYNSVSLDAVPFLPSLAKAVSRFVIDATWMGTEEAQEELRRLLQGLSTCKNEAAQPLPKMPGATTGHLFRGVQ